MASVSSVVKMVKQPRGGYIRLEEFEEIRLDDGNELSKEESIHASLIGLAVDYLTRYMVSGDVEDAFKISISGAHKVIGLLGDGVIDRCNKYISGISGLDDKSIEYACRLVTFDVWFRDIGGALRSKRDYEIIVDNATINNIRIMVERSIKFFNGYGGVSSSGFTFESRYTKKITSGDGDYITGDILWDMKVSKSKPDKNDILQVVIYSLLALNISDIEVKYFNGVRRVGIYNPRLNMGYILKLEDIDGVVIDVIWNDIMN